MDTQIENLRDQLHELLDGEMLIASEKILKISKELDQFTVIHLIAQTENQLSKEV